MHRTDESEKGKEEPQKKEFWAIATIVDTFGRTRKVEGVWTRKHHAAVDRKRLTLISPTREIFENPKFEKFIFLPGTVLTNALGKTASTW